MEHKRWVFLLAIFACLLFFSRGRDAATKDSVKKGASAKAKDSSITQSHHVSLDKSKSRGGSEQKKELTTPKKKGPTAHIAPQTFTFRELAGATKKFRPDCLLGEGGFGRVCKGRLGTTGQIVAVKQLDRNGLQGNREFLVEVLMLSLLHHTNLVNFIGYCADDAQRLLVYEYMPLGSLEIIYTIFHRIKSKNDNSSRSSEGTIVFARQGQPACDLQRLEVIYISFSAMAITQSCLISG